MCSFPLTAVALEGRSGVPAGLCAMRAANSRPAAREGGIVVAYACRSSTPFVPKFRLRQPGLFVLCGAEIEKKSSNECILGKFRILSFLKIIQKLLVVTVFWENLVFDRAPHAGPGCLSVGSGARVLR